MSKSYQNLYDKLESEFSKIKPVVESVEKGYLKINDSIEVIDGIILELLEELKVKGKTPLNRRLANLKHLFQTLKKQRGYDSKTFNTIYGAIERIEKVAPEEIVPSTLYESLKKRILSQETIEPKEQKKQISHSNKLHFLIAENGSMQFIVPIKKIVSTMRIETKKISSLSNEKLIVKLPGDNLTSNKKEKTLITVELKNKKEVLILADSNLGSLFIKKKLYERKKKTLRSENRVDEVLHFYGKNYFIFPVVLQQPSAEV